MRGRKPKPTEAKRKAGNPGKRALPEPVVVEGRVATIEEFPEPPDHFTKREIELWNRHAGPLVEAGLLDRSDEIAFAGLIEAASEAERAFASLRKEGPTVIGAHGTPVANPTARHWRDSRKLYLTYAEHFGFTPVARSRLGLGILAGRKLALDLDSRLPANPRKK